MSRQIVFTPKAAKPPATYSQAVKAAGLVFVSGTAPHDPATGQITGTTIQEQTRQCLTNIAAILEEAGSSLDKIVSVTVILADEDDMSSEWLHGRGQLPPWNAVDWSADPAWDWRSATDDSPEQLYALWRDAVARSRALLAAAMADGGPARRTGGPDSPAPSLRYILLNMIEEYARHNGHADLIRESIDGRVGHDPPR